MKIIKALGSGVAGAISLTLLHQLLKKVHPDAPRVDQLGMQAIAKGLDQLGINPPREHTLFKSSLAGDLLFNSIYYSFTAAGKIPLLSASLLGLGAGVGAVALPGPMGLDERFTARNASTKALAIGIYLFGGLAAAAIYKLLSTEDSEAVSRN